jgi:chromosome condensin MukBEF MukE localization factor
MMRVYFDQMLLDTFPKTRRRARKRSTKCMTRLATKGSARDIRPELAAKIERSVFGGLTDWERWVLYDLRISQERLERKFMATKQEVLDAVAKLSADFDAFAAAHQTSEAADMDEVKAAVDALDTKINPPA